MELRKHTFIYRDDEGSYHKKEFEYYDVYKSTDDLKKEFEEWKESIKSLKKRYFVNIYKDNIDRFISDIDYNSYKEAYDNRDKLTTYIETVEIKRNK